MDVDPGTYCFYSERWNGTQKTQLTVYIGFVPDNFPPEMQSTYVISDKDPAASEVSPFMMDAPDEFAEKVNGRSPDCTDTIATNWTGEGDVYRFTLDESGMLYIRSVEEKYSDSYYDLYCNKNLDIPVLRREYTTKGDAPDTESIKSIYLDAGTYYFQVTRWNGTGKTTIKTHFGFYPISKVFSVGLMETSPDQKNVRVHFETNEEYDPDRMKAQIRIIHKIAGAIQMNNKDFWNEKDLSNAIESHDFIATENGFYTARIAGNGMQPYLLTFEVTGITEDAPKQEQPMESESTPEPEITDAPAETKTPAAMSPDEMRKYIRMLEDQIDDLGLELPEFSPNLTQKEYMKQLEQVLHENGYEL